jgi:hypothetical protein
MPRIVVSVGIVHQPGEGLMVTIDMLAKAFIRLGFSANF